MSPEGIASVSVQDGSIDEGGTKMNERVKHFGKGLREVLASDGRFDSRNAEPATYSKESTKLTSLPLEKGSIRIFIKSEEGDQINLHIPLALLRFCRKPIKKHLDKQSTLEFDLETLLEDIENGHEGSWVDIESAEGDIVKISVEYH